MRYLDKLLSEHLKGKIILIPTAQTLSGGKGRYTDSVNVNGKPVRYRSKDGIHFTAEGQNCWRKNNGKIVFEPSTQPSSTQP
ncbi:protein PacB [Neisseria gonorrhoeae]|uniref:Protein PacB n=1 Tax=Neisseria gonorrhoeae TaxID=485 RepID=A0A378VXX4_NEIGO|nr:protein PacB [Neisseria gonorrhoeae]